MKIKTILLLFTLLPLFAVAETAFTPPVYPGGEMAMFKFLANHIEYPKYCADRYIQGRVVVQFIVRENGLVDSVCVESPGFPLMDKEAVRVARALYRFEPATEDGVPVKSTFKVPIRFKIQTSGFFFRFFRSPGPL